MDLIPLAKSFGSVREEARVSYKDRSFPIFSFSFGEGGSQDPVLVIVGGVHGLEAVGTTVALSYLGTFLQLMQWDQLTKDTMKKCRILFYPLANPVGMYRKSRSNGNGVDLMRNAPIDAEQKSFVGVGGHRVSPLLPWYRGAADAPMEPESQALCQFVKRETFQAKTCIGLDIHSGFGLVDRLWFPYAKSQEPFPEISKIYSLKQLLDFTFPNHVYKVEPQSVNYVTHGDIWDYLYIEHQRFNQDRKTFIPFSLEMGSWHWVRKNPKQVLSKIGIFNPVMPHRLQRIQRRHFGLIDFLLKAINSEEAWSRQEDHKPSVTPQAPSQAV